MVLSPPEPLTENHEIDDFMSGEGSLDQWLKRRARANQASGASRTYVVCQNSKVVGYYALASGSLSGEIAPGRFRRNMPEPIPVVILGRLAIDQAWQGKGIGRALFSDAGRRVLNAAGAIGIRGIVVHAISEQARRFYVALGLQQCRDQELTLVVTLEDLKAALG